MEVNEKIRFIREMKGWSQREMAEKLKMSTSGYSSIERGETNIQLSRLEQIAKLLEIKLSELTDFDDRNFQIFLGDYNDGGNISINSSDTQLKYKLEASQTEIFYLKKR
ncbi:MAG: helix-turn-helix transcriptional regulator [Candidatus Marithrix sp.]